MIKERIKQTISDKIKDLQERGEFVSFPIPKINIDLPRQGFFGDYSTNIAFEIARIINEKPKQIAEKLDIKDKILEKTEIVNGFINFFLSKDYLREELKKILKEKEKFGSLAKRKEKVSIEFISANPTGPLTLGNGRGGFCGDVLSNILKKAGYIVNKEYYINDRGEQIIRLGHSVLKDSEAVYKGEYIDELSKKIKERDIEKAGKKASKIILSNMIKPSVKKMGINFDTWFSEQSLYQKKEVDKALSELKDFTYEKDKALWFKSTQFGDDKDRVLIKGNGEKTYFASDIAYLRSKIERGFDSLIFFWGADHYGYIKRLEAIAQALGFKKERIKVILMQLVRLVENGKEVKMSKRQGTYIEIDELLSEVGLDVSRFFFLTRSPETHLNFELSLAKEQSEKNPIFYIQYAFARISSILRKKKFSLKYNVNLLNDNSEISLIKKLIVFPEVVKEISEDFQIQKITQYALELASCFHHFYSECKVISKDKELTKSRIALVFAVKIVLKETLSLMGIKAPEKM